MKFKMFAAAGLLAASSIVSAQSVSLGFAQRDLDSGAKEHQNSISVKTKAYGSFTGDVGLSATQNDATNAITNRYELGATYTQPLTSSLSADMRVAQGWKAKSGSETTTYYVIEPSVTAKIIGTPFSVKAGYRVRNAWESNVADNSTTSRLALGYNFTAKDRISLGRDWQRGDGAVTQTSLQYTRSF
ncbi:MAG: hypothetical protein RLY61_12 [Candidatus Parcubacteria bacterium]|jgi:hypothetical protein